MTVTEEAFTEQVERHRHELRVHRSEEHTSELQSPI